MSLLLPIRIKSEKEGENNNNNNNHFPIPAQLRFCKNLDSILNYEAYKLSGCFSKFVLAIFPTESYSEFRSYWSAVNVGG
jgi:hypothetical protein